MSKLFAKYSELKKQNPNFVYLFKVGIFYLALDEDAHTLSKNLKLNFLKVLFFSNFCINFIFLETITLAK